MRYFSTRDALREHPYSLKEAGFLGLAPDGGLFMPERVPEADLDRVRSLASHSYADMASYLASLFFGDDVPAGALEAMVRRAYDFDCPLRPLTRDLCCLELFHGPTFAFKDFGARFMGGMLGLLNDGSEDLTVLVATSGDTGSAVAAGFHNVPGINVVVLYPRGKVSPLQEAQMTTLGGNVRAVAVNGNFDDCQALVKQVFADRRFREDHNVTSANSINLLRWIPQSFYYFNAWAQWVSLHGDAPMDVVVPSGNYGNITAGMLAMRMGLPVRRFIAGSNANSVIPEFLEDGVYRPRPSVRTLANAMDVGAPSNYERMMYLFEDDFGSLSAKMSGKSYSDAEILDAVREIHGQCGFISDPHSAIGWMAARDSGAQGFYLATAHSAKFGEVTRRALPDVDVELPGPLSELMRKPKTSFVMENDLSALEAMI